MERTKTKEAQKMIENKQIELKKLKIACLRIASEQTNMSTHDIKIVGEIILEKAQTLFEQYKKWVME